MAAGMDVAQLVSQIMGGGESPAEPTASAADLGGAPDSSPAYSVEDNAPQKPGPLLPAETVRLPERT